MEENTIKENESQPVESQEQDYDALYDDVMGASSETPMEDEQTIDTGLEGAEQSTETDTEKTEKLWDLKRGEDVKQVNEEKYTEYAQKGLDYEIKMADMKAEREVFEQEKGQITQEKERLESQFGELATIQEYTVQNPQFLQVVQNEWAKVQGQPSNAAQDGSNPMTPIVQQLQAKINEFEGRFKKEDEIATARQAAEEEAALDKDIIVYKDKYPNFDWTTQNEKGKSLEEQILQHAIDSNIKNFKAAANDFLIDEHMKIANIHAKENAAKTLQNKNKMGLKGITLNSVKTINRAENVRNKSWDDLANEALSEFSN